MNHKGNSTIGERIYSGNMYKNCDYSDNFHNSYEFIYMEEGTLIATINNVSLTLEKDDMLLIAPNMIHSYQKTGDNSFFLCIFSSDYINEFYKNNFSHSFIQFKSSQSTLSFLKQNMFSTGTPEFYMLKSCLYAICSQCLSGTYTLSESNLNSTFVKDVNSYVLKNLSVPFTQKDIADSLNYESHYFSSLFSKTFKTGFKKYVNLYRIKQACRLLSTTNDKISEIAFNCGFSSNRSFDRAFKELTGKTPYEYRHGRSDTRDILADHLQSSPFMLDYDKINQK